MDNQMGDIIPQDGPIKHVRALVNLTLKTGLVLQYANATALCSKTRSSFPPHTFELQD